MAAITATAGGLGGALLGRKAPRLDPDSILRTVVYVQAAFRRFLVEEPRLLLGIRPTMPSPPLAVSLWCCRRLVRPESIDVEAEGMAVAVMICAREKGLTLGPIVLAYDRYAPRLPAGHPVAELLLERFGEVAVDAEEEIMARAQAAELPSQARSLIAEARQYWGAPDRPPGGGEELFPRLEGAMDALHRRTEDMLTGKLPLCRTKAGLQAMREAVDLEFVGWHTKLKGRVRQAWVAYKEFLELTAHTAFGWPPTGNLAPLCSSGRWFAAELGEDNPVVEDFVAAVKRIRGRMEKDALEELTPHLEALSQIRAKLFTDPPPPRLLLEGYTYEHEEQLAETMPVLQRVREEIGTESPEVLQMARGIMQPELFARSMAEECEEAASILRRPLPPTIPGLSTEEGEERLAAAVRLYQLLAQLKVDDPTRAATYQAEFPSELGLVRPSVTLLCPEADAPDEEGWHKPPGFDMVERPLGQPTPPPTPPPPTPPPKPQTPEPEPDVKVKMRLHGVTIKEAQHNSEILLLEKLALIVAKECGVPREWITHISLAPPKTKEEEEAEEAEAALERAMIEGEVDEVVTLRSGTAG